MDQFELKGHIRQDKGKGASRRLRRTGKMPAILYGAGKDPIPLTLTHNDIFKNCQHESFYSHVLTLHIEGQASEKAVLKDLQRHPYLPILLHLDLQRVTETEYLYMRIPVHFINEDKSPGVKQGGGVISHHLSEVEVRCLAKNLPEFIEVDLSEVQLNHTIHLSNLTLPAGVEIAALLSSTAPDHDLPVVSVHLPRGTAAEEGEITPPAGS